MCPDHMAGGGDVNIDLLRDGEQQEVWVCHTLLDVRH